MLLLLGCGVEGGGGGAPTDLGRAVQEEAWSSIDRPSLMSSNLQYGLSALPRSGQSDVVPWAGTYWPAYLDSINYRWNGASTDSPAKKYEKAFGLSGVEDAVSAQFGVDAWSYRTACTQSSNCRSSEACAKRAGASSGYCIPTWFGVCHAWAAASMLLPEPRFPVTVNGVTFKVNDIKALVTIVHDKVNLRFVSGRCNDNASAIAWDSNGRPASAVCRDTNPGTFHVLLANYLGILRKTFLYDRIFDNEVWNQPIRSFQVVEMNEVSASEANRLITGAPASGYLFNPNAASFYSVVTDVRYINESAPWTDGNLSASIDFYTHTDRLSYVLELDASGKIIGGEWVGDSKRLHPDFVWLPLGPRDQAVASGLIRVDQVKQLLDQSVAGTGGGDGGVLEERTFSDSGNIARGEWRHYGPFRVAEGGGLTATIAGTNDADLYVRRDAPPTYSAYDCRPYLATSNEICTIEGPADVYVSVNGYYNPASWFELNVRYLGLRDANPQPPPPPPQHLSESGSVSRGEMKIYALDVVAGRRVVVRTTAPNDVDLYLKMNEAPTLFSFLLRAWSTSGNETLSLTPTASGTLYIGVYGYAASSYTLTTADN
jgi:hypothetical protein